MNTSDVKAKGIDRAAQAERMLSAAGLDVLGALRTGIVCVLPDGTISAVNDAAADALGRLSLDISAPTSGSRSRRCTMGADTTSSSRRWTTARRVCFTPRSRAAAPNATHEIRVARTRAGWLVFELRESLAASSATRQAKKASRCVRSRVAWPPARIRKRCCRALRRSARVGGADGAAVGAAGRAPTVSSSPRQAARRLTPERCSASPTRWLATRCGAGP